MLLLYPANRLKSTGICYENTFIGKILLFELIMGYYPAIVLLILTKFITYQQFSTHFYS